MSERAERVEEIRREEDEMPSRLPEAAKIQALLAEIDRLREERERLRDKKTGTQLKGDFNYSVWEAECENGHKTYHEDDPDTAYCAKCGGMLNGVVRLVPDWEVWQAQLEAAHQALTDSEDQPE